jgi:uncharacterized protein YsxB (DUF464 family)
MIRVLKNDNKIVIKGHACYDEYGKDIVCASVSSIVITTVNAILEIDRDPKKYKEEKDILTIEILKEDKIVMKLINNMLNLLKELSNNYPKNIEIREDE